MPCFKIHFLNFILTVLFFTSVKSAHRYKAFDSCISQMKQYCYYYIFDHIRYPTTLHCVQVAIDHWQTNSALGVTRKGEIPEGPVRDYYLSFKSNLKYDHVMVPNNFCKTYEKRLDLFVKCHRELVVFPGDQMGIVNYALYKTKTSRFVPNKEKAGKSNMAESSSKEAGKPNKPEQEPEPKKPKGSSPCFTVAESSIPNKEEVAEPIADKSNKDYYDFNFGKLYMEHIKSNIGSYNGIIRQPWEFCRHRYFPEEFL